MAYSWRCLISNYLSYRDPNQWTCSHSCRWEFKVFKNEKTEAELETVTGRPEDYQELTGNFYLEEKERPGEMMEIDEDEYWTYLMNSRDLCAIDYIKDLADAWVISFKVEWRNKTVNYIASTAMAYREALDAVEKWEKYDVKKLADELFSIANRWYIPWFLAGNPGVNAQFYERNGWFQTKVFLWIIRNFDEKNKLARIEVKNRFELWDEIEIVTPNWIYNSKVETIKKITTSNNSIWKKWFKPEVYDEKLSEDTTQAHGWWYEVWINMEKDFGDFAIIRKKLEQ
jgi:putative protease